MQSVIPIIAGILGGALFLLALIPAWIQGWRYTFLERAPKSLVAGTPHPGDALRLLGWMLAGSLFIYATAYLAGRGDFYNALVKADALHYIEIAKNGYTNLGETRYFLVFFPLFPYAMKAMTYLTGSYLLSAILLNNGFLYGAMWYLYRMGCRYYGRGTAFRAAKYISLFPLALFFRNPYTESLFLLLSVASIYYAMEGKLPLSGILGLLCALCRSTGVILMLPIFMEGIRSWRMGEIPLYQAVLWTLLPLVGTGAYLYLNYAVAGNPFQFLTYQKEHWYNGFASYPHSLVTTTRHLLQNAEAALTPFWIAQFVAILLFGGLLATGGRKLHPTHFAYAVAGFYLMLSQTWLLSGARYLMGLALPFYILGRWAEKPLVDSAVTLLSVLGLFAITWLFASGIPIY